MSWLVPCSFARGRYARRPWGQNHPDVADSLHPLALSLYSDNVSFAIPLLLRSKEIREKVFGHDHPPVADSLHAMARLYEAHSGRDLAIPLYQQALTIQEKVFGPKCFGDEAGP
ncbi:MAG: tetratricopeptide repeat protein [Nitrospira sp.]